MSESDQHEQFGWIEVKYEDGETGYERLEGSDAYNIIGQLLGVLNGRYQNAVKWLKEELEYSISKKEYEQMQIDKKKREEENRKEEKNQK